MAMELIETIEVGAGGAASIEFTSIPQDGTDLVLLYSIRSSVSTIYLTLNNDTGANYNFINLEGQGGSGYGPFSSSVSNSTSGFAIKDINRTSSTASTFSSVSVYISNYTANSAKSVSYDYVSEANSATAFQYLYAGLWDNTASVTSLKLDNNQQEFTTASLYKIY